MKNKLNDLTKNFMQIALSLMLCFFLSACVGPSYPKASPLAVDVLPESSAAEKLPPYHVQIGDVLDIKFYLNPEFDETVTVRPDGMISTKIADDIYIYNKTTAEVSKQLKPLYKKDLKKPYITTIVRSFAPIRIYVSGEVNNPGEFVVVGHALTLTQAIARAGGVKNSAQADKVLILRRGASEKSKTFVVDYDGATQGGDPLKDIRLAAYDVVFVPKSGAALFYKGYQQKFQQFIAPSLGLGVSYSLNP
jgi:polysaccharide export outer membrane protein